MRSHAVISPPAGAAELPGSALGPSAFPSPRGGLFPPLPHVPHPGPPGDGAVAQVSRGFVSSVGEWPPLRGAEPSGRMAGNGVRARQ